MIRADRNIFGEAVGGFTGIDDPQVGEVQIVEGDSHGFGEAGGVGIFEFHAPIFAALLPEEVEFRAGVGAPEIEQMIHFAESPAHALQGEAFPGRA